jgi:nicotinamidase-related amidase
MADVRCGRSVSGNDYDCDDNECRNQRAINYFLSGLGGSVEGPARWTWNSARDSLELGTSPHRTFFGPFMDAMLVVDMQVGLLNGEPKHDLLGVIERINRLAAKVRERSGTVIFVQHCGCEGDDFEPQTPGWAFLPDLVRDPADVVVQKTLNDPFAGTDLQARLEIASDRVLITGWATDLCVDATVRSAVAHHHHVVVVADSHTLSDRPHLDAVSVIRHHHWIWRNLITQQSVKLADANELLL